MRRPPPTITISGVIGSGKTTLLMLIRLALRAAGLTASIPKQEHQLLSRAGILETPPEGLRDDFHIAPVFIETVDIEANGLTREANDDLRKRIICMLEQATHVELCIQTLTKSKAQLNEELRAMMVKISGTEQHTEQCAVNLETPGFCSCTPVHKH